MLFALTVDILIWMFMMSLPEYLQLPSSSSCESRSIQQTEDESQKNKAMMTAEHISKQATMKEIINREVAMRFCSIGTD